MRLLYRIAALIGAAAPLAIIYTIGFYTHPAISISIVLWNGLAAYFFSMMIMLAGQTIIESLILVLMATTLILIALFASGDLLSENIQLLLWSLLLAAWYTPAFIVSLVVLFDADQTADQPEDKEEVDAEAAKRQQLIEKSLRRRQRKTKKA